jgi:hypothetical protein
MSNGTNIANESLRSASQTESSTGRPSLGTCVSSCSPVQPQSIEELRTWLQAAFPASHSVPPASDKAKTTPATCGPQPWTASARYDPDSRSWKTLQACLVPGISEPSWEIWPKAGTTHAGAFYPQPKWERRIAETEFGLLPTPTDASKGGGSSRSGKRIGETPTLQGMARKGMWPTPRASDANGPQIQPGKQGGLGLNQTVGGQLNPTWVELLMGWPLDWTSLNPIDVVQCRQWLMGFKGDNNAQAEANTREVLRVLREEAGEEAVQRCTRGLENIREAQALRPQVRQQPSEVDQAWLQLEGTQVPQDELRGVRMGQEAASASPGSEHREQCAREHSDLVQAMSRLLAHYGEEAWKDGSWENATPRTVIGTLAHRVDRLKAIGNGIVPQVAATAWRLLTEDL